MAALTMCDRCSDVKENFDARNSWARVTADVSGPSIEVFDLCPDCWPKIKAEILGQVQPEGEVSE